MELLNLTLVNFRNFANKKVVFDKELTVILGENGSGKSNIIGAIGLLSAVKLWPVESDLDFIRFGQSEAKVEGKVEGDEVKVLTINFQVIDETYIKKAYFVDSIKKRLFDFRNFLSMVVFEPSDLDLVTGSPSLRRHHLDILLSSVDREYWRSLYSYNKVITRRNKVLLRIQEGKAKKAELDFWDGRLLEHGKVVSEKRKELFEFLNFVEPSYAKASEGKKRTIPDLSWSLVQSVLTEEKIEKNRDRDIAAGMTLSGPQRDDFKFLSRGKNLEYFGSRGEQRMAVLALKLAELEFFSVKRQARPILALDDIFSELDWDHRRAVLDVIGNQQTIITAAEADSVPKGVLKKSKVVEL